MIRNENKFYLRVAIGTKGGGKVDGKEQYWINSSLSKDSPVSRFLVDINPYDEVVINYDHLLQEIKPKLKKECPHLYDEHEVLQAKI